MVCRFWALFCPAVASAILQIPTKEISPGVDMPVLSIGTGGDAKWHPSTVSTIVTNWMALGGRGVDTAFIYGTQGAVHRAIRDSGVSREEVFVTSKVPLCLGGKFFADVDDEWLKTSYIDLLLIHSHIGLDCKATWRQLEQLVAKGKVRALGVSNWKSADFEKLLPKATVLPVVNQIEHNVLNHDDETIAYCQAHNITIEAYSPLGQGGNKGDVPGNAVVQAVAASHNVSSYQVGLKWIIQHGHALTFQSEKASHQESDADLFGFDLTDDEMSTLDGLQARVQALEAVQV